jgi:uncharacterized protein DUF1404
MLYEARLEAVAAAERGALLGPLLALILLSPGVEALSAHSLLVHHFVHWSWAAGGALVGYQLRGRRLLPENAVVPWFGLGLVFVWHLPPFLGWAGGNPGAHAFAHLTLIAGGFALGWTVPKLGSATRAALLITANVVMWPLVLAEVAGAFTYDGYAGQDGAAGVAELVAMSMAWVVLALWSTLARLLSGSTAVRAVHALLALGAVVVWFEVG